MQFITFSGAERAGLIEVSWPACCASRPTGRFPAQNAPASLKYVGVALCGDWQQGFSGAERAGLIEVAWLFKNYALKDWFSGAERAGLIEVASAGARCASSTGFPAQNAPASLKYRNTRKPSISDGLFSGAERASLIEVSHIAQWRVSWISFPAQNAPASLKSDNGGCSKGRVHVFRRRTRRPH